MGGAFQTHNLSLEYQAPLSGGLTAQTSLAQFKGRRCRKSACHLELFTQNIPGPFERGTYRKSVFCYLKGAQLLANERHWKRFQQSD